MMAAADMLSDALDGISALLIGGALLHLRLIAKGHAQYPRDTQFSEAMGMLLAHGLVALCEEHHQPCADQQMCPHGLADAAMRLKHATPALGAPVVTCPGMWCLVLTDAGKLIAAADRLEQSAAATRQPSARPGRP